MVLAETKSDETFTTSSFLIDGFCLPFRLDRNRKGGGILMTFLLKLLTKQGISNEMRGLVIKINYRNIKWLLFETYHSPSQSSQH